MASSLSIFGSVVQWLHVRDRLALRSACQTTQSDFEIRASCSAEQIAKAKEEERQLVWEAREREVTSICEWMKGRDSKGEGEYTVWREREK